MLGLRKAYERKENQVVCEFQDGTLVLTVLTPEIFRIYVPREGHRHISRAIEGEKAVQTAYQVTEEKEFWRIETESLIAQIYDQGYVDFYKKDGTLLCADYRGQRIFQRQISENFIQFLKAEGHEVPEATDFDYPVQAVKKMDGEECFYGLGDKTGFLNKRDYEYENWNSDLPQAHTDSFKALYKSIPFLITKKKNAVFGLFFDNTYRAFFNLGKENQGYYFYGAEDGCLDYYFIAGKKMTDVVTNYTYLTGRTPLPQLWTIGHHQTRWGYECAEDVREVAEHYRELEIPCDDIMLDIDYMDNYKVFTWNEKAFGKAGDIVRELNEKGFQVVTILDPGVKVEEGYDKYEEGREKDYFAKTPEGEIYVNAVWPGDSVFPDFGNPETRKWWADNQKYFVDLGVRGIWNDMNEPASFHGELPKDVVFHEEENITDHAAIHNVYGHLMSKATFEGLKEQDGRRPFVITRACYAGTQKYATVWTGDNQSLWAHLQMAVPQLCNLGLSGFAFAGTDVGGFGADCTKELMCRWVQVGCFSPLFRNHSSKGSTYQEPWQFDQETIEIYRKFVNLRYQLLPYLYDLFYQSEKTGLPIMRPLVLHYEDDEETHNLNGEFLLGEHILAAPVLEQGATKKMTYLPKGMWYEFETGKAYEGGRYYLIDAPLDTCPMFVKEGSILPTYEVQSSTSEKKYENLILRVYPGKGSYQHYHDNGEDYAYREGEYELYEFQNNDGDVSGVRIWDGYSHYRKIFIQRISERTDGNGGEEKEELEIS